MVESFKGKTIKQPGESFVRSKMQEYIQLSPDGLMERTEDCLVLAAAVKDLLMFFLGQNNRIEALDDSVLPWYKKEADIDPIPEFNESTIRALLMHLKGNYETVLQSCIKAGARTAVLGPIARVTHIQQLLSECNQSRKAERVFTKVNRRFAERYQKIKKI